MHTFMQARSSCRYNHIYIYIYIYIISSVMHRTGAWISILVVAVLSLTILSQTCPSEQFSAVFTASVDLTYDTTLAYPQDDPELVFNDRYGLDFSASTPNEKNERFFENAKMSPFIVPPEVDYIVTINSWFQSGNTHSMCYLIRDGGFQVSFSANQTLRGSYGGATGKPAGLLVYGFYNIEVCKQSPVIIQYQSATLYRIEPIDGIAIANSELYNRVLGHRRAQGIIIVIPDPDEPGRLRVHSPKYLHIPSLVNNNYCANYVYDYPYT